MSHVFDYLVLLLAIHTMFNVTILRAAKFVVTLNTLRTTGLFLYKNISYK